MTHEPSVVYQLILSKGTESNIEEIKEGLRTAPSASFEPIGSTVKDSVEKSSSCEAGDNGESVCEVPDFAFLSAESDEKNPALDSLLDMLNNNDAQLIECSGII